MKTETENTTNEPVKTPLLLTALFAAALLANGLVGLIGGVAELVGADTPGKVVVYAGITAIAAVGLAVAGLFARAVARGEIE